MCLIIDNPQGATIDPTLIMNALTGNADGWGFMTSRKGRIHITRGMTPGGLDDAIRAHEGIPHVIHFRFGTHGTKSLDNCHPFSVLDGRYAVMHNGILSVPRHDADRSDTWHFCEYVLGPILKTHPELFGTQYLTVMLESLIGSGNKLVIMRQDGATMIVNRKAGCDHDGLWLSNSYSLPGKASLLSSWGKWEDDEEDTDVRTIRGDDDEADCRSGSGSPYAEFPKWLTELADLEYGDLVDFVCDHPESVAELIGEYFEYEMN